MRDVKTRYQVICREVYALGFSEDMGIEIARLIKRHEDAALAERDAWVEDAEVLAQLLKTPYVDQEEAWHRCRDAQLVTHDRLVAGQTEADQ